MQHSIFMSILAFFFYIFVLVGSAPAQISIEGVADKHVYNDSASFKVHSEADFNYTAELNGNQIATDVSIEVNEPKYYELNVSRIEQTSGAQQNELVRFIVRATERGNTEWGLPPWTPYPQIDSAANEFAGAKLKIVTVAEFPMELEIPVIARVENETGNRLGVNCFLEAPGFQEHRLQLLRGMGSVFLPAATAPGVIFYSAEIQSIQAEKQINIEAATTWQTVSEDITSSTDWGENARIHISNVTEDLLTITSNAILTIGRGSIIIIDPDVEIAVQGNLQVNGTQERPVVFTARNRNIPWGGFLFESSSSQGQFAGAILTGSGADSNWFNNNPGHGSSHRKEQCLFYLSGGAHVTLNDCYLVENQGQAGHGEGAYLTMTGCLIQKCITAGQYNGGAVILKDCALIEFPSATADFVDNDNDAIYLSGGAHSFTDCLIGWTLDDGIDAGSGAEGSVEVNNCWFESCYHEAMAWSDTRDADVTDTVTLNCGQGIECGYGAPDVNAVHCLSTANLVGARFGDNFDWDYNGFLKVSNSLLLFNKRDVWGRAWDNWTLHLSQMDIQNNYLSTPNPNFPINWVWNPDNDSNQIDELESFLPTPADIVGIGLATLEDIFDLSELPNIVTVRLSTFTTSPVSVDYAIYAGDDLYDSGSLQFIPGQTIKHIQFVPPLTDSLNKVRIMLSNPVNAQLTRFEQITYIDPNEFVEPLVIEGDLWQYFKGLNEPPVDWNQLSFDDSAWSIGATGIGYEAGIGYQSCIATDLSDMQNNYISVYARHLFFVDDSSQFIGLTLSVDFDDGYIAYINGIRVDSQNPPNPPAYDQPATGSHEACSGTGTPSGPCPLEQVDLSNHITHLVPGLNVLAFQVHNSDISSSDFLFIPQLFGVIAPPEE